MTQTRFACTLTRADEPECQSYARVTIVDAEGASARACPRHAVTAFNGITAHADWSDSKGPQLVEAHGPGAGRRTKPARLALDPVS